MRCDNNNLYLCIDNLKIMKSLLLIFVLLFLSCNNRQNVDNIISQAEAALPVNVDSALVMLQGIHEPDLTDSLKAKYWLVVGQIHNNTGRSMAEDSLLADALEYYKKDNSNIHRTTQSHILYAKHLWWKGDKDVALKLLNQYLDNMQEARDTIATIHILKTLANFNDRNQNFAEAVRCLKKLLAIDLKVPDPYTYYGGLSIQYYYLKEKDSTLYYAKKACESVKQLPSQMELWCQFTRNYADFLSDFGDDRAAIVIQKKALHQYLQSKNKYTAESYLSLSRYYLNLHQIDSAKYYMQLVDKFRSSYNDNDLSFHVNNLVQSTLMQYAATNRLTIRDMLLFSNWLYDDYIDMEKVIVGKSEAKRILEQRNLNLTIAKQRNLILLIIVLFVVVLSTAFIAFYIKRRKKQLEEKEEELDTLKQLCVDVQKENTENDQFFKKILLQQMGIIKMVAANPTSHNQEFLTQMARITHEDIATDELLVWEDLYKVIDSTYNNFYTNIMLRVGMVMNERELQLCCLLKANFSTKEISVVTGQSVRTVYQRKTTIRQKLNMDEKEDITDHLNDLIQRSE